MKISEVCRRTGLSERTVRYYEEEGFIFPAKNEIGGRSYRDYSETEIEELETCAALRRLLFTIDEIKTMRQEPELIPEVLAAYRERLGETANRMNDVLAVIDRLDLRYVSDVRALARGFALVAESRTVPETDVSVAQYDPPALEPHEVKLRFGKFDEEKKDDPEAAERFYKSLDEKIRRGEKLMTAIIVIEVVLEIISLVTNFSGAQVFGFVLTLVILGAINGGVRWVRYAYAILGVFSSVVLFFSFFAISSSPEVQAMGVGFLIVLYVLAITVWRILCTVWLFASKNISAYLEYKRS